MLSSPEPYRATELSLGCLELVNFTFRHRTFPGGVEKPSY